MYRFKRALAVLVIGLIISGCSPRRVIRTDHRVFTGYAAKVVGSAVFVGDRPKEDAERTDMFLGNTLHRYIKMDYDPEPEEQPAQSEITATMKIFGKKVVRKAIYRKDAGVVLLPENYEGSPPLPPVPVLPPKPDPEPFQFAHLNPEEREAIDKVVDSAFKNTLNLKRTRAVLILQDGKIVAERYAPTYDKDSKLLSWSMAKSFLNAIVGILIYQGKLNLHDRMVIPQWAGQPQKEEITIDQMLHMLSGLKFEDKFLIKDDQAEMLMLHGNMAKYAAGKELKYEPGTHWKYSSGTSLILSRHLKSIIGKDDYLPFIYRELLYKIGMNSALVETDLDGTFVASSYIYATTRDYARFGQLFLNDGVVDGERILPTWWRHYSTETVPQSGKDCFAAHFYSNDHGQWKGVPTDAFMAQGFLGQMIAIVPSRGLVVIRLGHSTFGWPWDSQDFLADVIAALPCRTVRAIDFNERLARLKERYRSRVRNTLAN